MKHFGYLVAGLAAFTVFFVVVVPLLIAGFFWVCDHVIP